MVLLATGAGAVGCDLEAIDDLLSQVRDGGGPTSPQPPCALVDCAVGTHCEEHQVECVKAPCPPIATCVPNADRLFCGGIAGVACPGSGTCEDDQLDDCDPKNGGRDCGGVCLCVPKADCKKGETFDSSVNVCACVPAPKMCGPVCEIYCQYGNVLDAQGCPTCSCKPAPTK
ncbi:MAG TPA: hypothetical protein VHU40_18855 [Polyangia bacterium]|nr:hypothetical protein [Polyangia bacterium]